MQAIAPLLSLGVTAFVVGLTGLMAQAYAAPPALANASANGGMKRSNPSIVDGPAANNDARAYGANDPTNQALRTRGPEGLAALLDRYDVASGAARDALADRIDAVAGQRYATVSRLYWYTDLAEAQRAAQATRRPILALRMLGDLREDLSCANSRLFRAVLYANAELSAFLRDHFVLYWSSERAVPRVTIELGDGRKIVRTTTGNSAHYVLDADGHVLDVLPGMYAPSVFQRELTKSLALADRVRGVPAARRNAAVIDFHVAGAAAAQRSWTAITGTTYMHGDHYLGDSEAKHLALAQRATISKMRMEVPDLQVIGLLEPSEVPDETAAWAAIGQKAWRFDPRVDPRFDPRPDATAPPRLVHTNTVPAPRVLDAQSRALVAQLHDAGPADQRATPEELADVIARLEQSIVADTALDEFTLRATIRGHLIRHPDLDLTALNAWIYSDVFATPPDDAWMGLRTRREFTGLPGDGVVMP